MIRIRLLLCATILTTSIALVGQTYVSILERSVTIVASDEPMDKLLKRLEEQGDFSFAYSPEAIDITKKITIDAKEKSLKKVLQEIFKGEQVECKEIKNKIFIRKRKETGHSPYQGDSKRPSVGGYTAEVDFSNNKEAQEEVDGRLGKSDVIKHKSKTDHSDSIVNNPLTPSTQQPDPLRKTQRNFSAMALSTVTQASSIQSLPTKPYIFGRQDKLRQEPPHSKVRSDVEYQWPEDNKPMKAPKERKLRDERKFRMYGASTTSYTQIGDMGGIVMGGRGAYMFNKRFGLGLAGYAFQTDKISDSFLGQEDFRYSGGYGGLMMEYTIAPDRAVHVTFPLVLGVGGAVYSQNQITDSKTVIDSQAILVMEPGVELEFNVIKFIKLSFGTTYRMTSNATLIHNQSEEELLGKSGLNGLSAACTVKFGIF
jgi:hypothetical protein